LLFYKIFKNNKNPLRINNKNKEEIKIDIANKQIQFLETINFDDIIVSPV
jgi:hypothetical protein